MRKRIGIVAAIVAALAIGAVAINARGAPEARPAVEAKRGPVAVGVAPARQADVAVTVTATGTVAALREAKIAAKNPGRVAVVLVKEGQRVTAGTPLMRLDTAELAAQTAQASADLMGARARLTQLQVGARPEERRQSADAYAQAQAAVRLAQARVAAMERGARPQEREQAADAVARAKAALDLAQADAQRMRSLHEMGAVSRQALESAETQLRLAQTNYNSALQQQSMVHEGPRIEDLQAARAQLVQAQAAASAAQQAMQLVEQGPRTEEISFATAQVARSQAFLAAARVRLVDATVTAPFAGTVVQRDVEPGESVSPAVHSFIIADLDEVLVELAVPERYHGGLTRGQSATIRVDALPGRTFAGRVDEIGPAAALASRTFLVKVRVPNLNGTLRPGTFARGAIVTATRASVLQIPEAAILLTSGKPIVFVVKDGRALRREVTIGERSNGFVEVTAGIETGDQVVVQGHEGLTDNQPVAPRAPTQ
ncbi:MAG: efflux RND transporter periplasmic adaptor subunit [Armatimonadota bacterium]